MGADPYFVNGDHESILIFPWYLASGVPSCATVNEMEYDLLVDKEQVTLDLGIKRVGELCAAYVCWARLGPFSADTASLHDLWNELYHTVSNTNSFEEALHGMV
jgi:hypothetical protein